MRIPFLQLRRTDHGQLLGLICMTEYFMLLHYLLLKHRRFRYAAGPVGTPRRPTLAIGVAAAVLLPPLPSFCCFPFD